MLIGEGNISKYALTLEIAFGELFIRVSFFARDVALFVMIEFHLAGVSPMRSTGAAITKRTIIQIEREYPGHARCIVIPRAWHSSLVQFGFLVLYNPR